MDISLFGKEEVTTAVNFSGIEEMLNSDNVLEHRGNGNTSHPEEVKAAQELLMSVAGHNSKGFDVDNVAVRSQQILINGSGFGDLTLDTVRAYQESRDIQATGNIGPQTKEALGKDFEELKDNGYLIDSSVDNADLSSAVGDAVQGLKDVTVASADATNSLQRESSENQIT